MSILRSYSPAWVKRVVWDRKHTSGTICPEACPSDLLESLGELPVNAAVLDMGCGPGNLRAALRLRGWRGYFVGVDISARAIELAQETSDPSCEWHVCSIESFRIPDRAFHAICFSESIYYARLRHVPRILAMCRESLTPEGTIFIRIWHRERHQDYVRFLLNMGAENFPPMYILHNQNGDRDVSPKVRESEVLVVN